ncbi:metallophosphoesterase [Euhalothece natronophila Z-M001]|uniref:Metallophosphoesterase n=1 Tax=Euhalothece natronophila Z-M001 TaxID=522448 RepID=A0A5B8NQT7_9CHRO|nr:metallophosphoesterase family protein [Euhalothece natronophila]QDZ41368.1 metallophosphoesterase [Euhalothece natronophila Z-M001]
MSHWAILSGIEGNLAAYEAVLADIKQQEIPVTEIYILGDVIGLGGNNEEVVKRIQFPQSGEVEPQVCTGWWEEQCFNLYALSGFGDAPELKERYGSDGVLKLWESVSRETVQWLRNLAFGFHEEDCLLIHGSTVSYDDELTPETPAIQICDRVLRAEANTLFCGRSGLAFEYCLENANVNSTVRTLDQATNDSSETQPLLRVIGVGNVGRNANQGTYTLYEPVTGEVKFQTVNFPITLLG